MFPAWVRASSELDGELDAAGLAPAADEHLGLHHHRVAEPLGRGDRARRP